MFNFDPLTHNVTPSRYRQVGLATGLETLDPDALQRRFVGREAYMRTRFIVVRSGSATALVEVDRPESSELFSPIADLRVLAGADQCRYVVAPEIDCGVPSQLATAAMEHLDVACVVVEGRYSHVSFILNANPLRLRVLDVVPPFPSKLLDQVRRVLEIAEELPPIIAVPMLVDSRDELRKSCLSLPSRVLVPCRGSGVEFEGVAVSYLDDRPPAADWTLLGCERSHQIHRWFYGASPPTVDICPVRFLPEHERADGSILSRCCLIQEGVQERRMATFVPWGASLAEVREAIERVVRQADVRWTPT